MSKISIRIHLLLIFLTGIIALGYVIGVHPSLNTALTLFSSSYQAVFRKFVLLLLVSLVGILLFLLCGVFYISFARPLWFDTRLEKVKSFFLDRRKFLIFILTVLFGLLAAGQYATPADYVNDEMQRVFLQVTRPLFLWGIWVLLSNFCILALLSGHFKDLHHPETTRSILFFLFIVCVGSIFLRSGFGYKYVDLADNSFNLTGYPILGYQVISAWLVALVLFLTAPRWQKRRDKMEWVSRWGLDLLISLSLFLFTFFLWDSAPLKENMFIDQPRPPNQEIYPNSDAMVYDRTSLTLLSSGNLQSYLGNWDFVGLRPAYTVFLAALHKVGGLGYQEIIPFQIGVFAFSPVLLYALIRVLHSRSAGIFGALLLIFRGYNGLILTGVVTGVNAKLLMSEIPTMMGVMIFLLLSSLWIKNREKNATLLLLIGGVLGGIMLIRPEVAVLFPILVVIGFFTHRRKIGLNIRGMLLIVFGIMLVTSPWVIRNWQRSGEIYLNRPANYVFSVLGSKGEDQNLERSQGDEKPSTSKRDGNHLETISYWHVQEGDRGTGLLQLQVSPYSFNPEETGYKNNVDHFVNQWVQSVVYLPSYPLMLDVDYLSKMLIGRLGPYYGGVLYSPIRYVKQLPYWWNGWDGSIPPRSVISVLLTVFFIAWGIVGIWKKDASLAMLPLLSMAGYFGIYSFLQRSGGRFIQEVDWITTLYYSIGWIEITQLGFRWWKGEPLWEDPKQGRAGNLTLFTPGFPVFLIFVLALLILGLIPPLAEYLTPNRYPISEVEGKLKQTVEEIESLPSSQDVEIIKRFIERGGNAVWGRGFYPRQFYPGEDLKDMRSYVAGDLERIQYARSEAYLTGSDSVWAIVFRETPPPYFPHGSEVLALGCENKGVLDVLVMFFYEDDGKGVQSVIWRDGNRREFSGCPLPSPEE